MVRQPGHVVSDISNTFKIIISLEMNASSTLVTMIDASPPWAWWKLSTSFNGYSHTMSLLSRKKGLSGSPKQLLLGKSQWTCSAQRLSFSRTGYLDPKLRFKLFQKAHHHLPKSTTIFGWRGNRKNLIHSYVFRFAHLWLVIDGQDNFSHPDSFRASIWSTASTESILQIHKRWQEGMCSDKPGARSSACWQKVWKWLGHAQSQWPQAGLKASNKYECLHGRWPRDASPVQTSRVGSEC